MKLTLEQWLQDMWLDYLMITPDAKPIHQLFTDLSHVPVINDHIALRTFNVEKVSLDKIATPFLEAGYRPMDDYQFVAKKIVRTILPAS